MSVFRELGASNHSDIERSENDYYATPPIAVELLLEEENFSSTIWECACGGGHISRVLEDNGYMVISTDLYDRGYGDHRNVDFLETSGGFFGDIITNPPYKYAMQFAEHALELVEPGCKVAMLMRLQFLEGKERKEFFKRYPPKTVYVFSGRISCGHSGNFTRKHSKGAQAYAWYVWEKGYTGDTVIRWIN